MKALIAAAALLAASPALAADAREFCPDRPGLLTPPCTIDKGRAALEVGLVDWTLDKQEGERTDTLILGDMLLRYGLSDRVEVQLGWTPFGRVRERTAGGGVGTMSGTGDVSVAVRGNLIHPDGSGFSAALMPFATLPTGGRAIGAGTWSAGLLLPVSYDLPHGLQLGFTGRVEAAADEDRHGRHLAYGGIIGLSGDLADKLSATAEFSAQRDRDPSGHATELLGSVSIAYLATPDLQLDAGAVAGLSKAAPDVELYVGIARRF